MIHLQSDTQLKISYKIAVPQNAIAISQLVNSAYRGDSSKQGWTTEADILGGQRTDPEQILQMISQPDSVILLAYAQAIDIQDKIDSNQASDEHLIGCCLLQNIAEARTAYFGMFAILPTLQAGGVGKQMLAYAEKFVVDKWQARFMEMTVITVRKELIAWYERRGYEYTGELREFPTDPAFGIHKIDGIVLGVWRKALA